MTLRTSPVRIVRTHIETFGCPLRIQRALRPHRVVFTWSNGAETP